MINDGKAIYHTALTVKFERLMMNDMMNNKLRPPCDPVLSRKLLRLNSVFLEARNWINLCKKYRIKTRIHINVMQQRLVSTGFNNVMGGFMMQVLY